jgi:hypothetical protein
MSQNATISYIVYPYTAQLTFGITIVMYTFALYISDVTKILFQLVDDAPITQLATALVYIILCII